MGTELGGHARGVRQSDIFRFGRVECAMILFPIQLPGGARRRNPAGACRLKRRAAARVLPRAGSSSRCRRTAPPGAEGGFRR
jgi:hypothetical protein